ncbi:dimethyladenosine transferase 1, mitochondrial [Coccinella septempunctata]|uniref:dimethyladenosine transferase 1, mitochondrial n=1 Tax=Coccinella septempunctata TaxID=41139 RepID=UPI001D06C433|nr:dimethyladenosine transferase 1, mitochondrial [Coccinella septempunctata]
MTSLRLPPLPTIKDLIKLYKLRALKQLSQNFLLDERITDKIVRAAGNINNHVVLEVGPGPGSITRSILKKNPSKLILVEKDPRFLPILQILQEACEGKVDINLHIGDIRSYDFNNGLKHAQSSDWYGVPPPIHLIGNLPFSVSTILLVEWLHSISEREAAWKFGRTSMTLTFQKEVAERMVAPPGHKQRCRLSVICQLWCEVQNKFLIPGRAFLPKPDVDVGVVTLKPLKYPLTNIPFKMAEKILRNIFNMRQKYSFKGASRLFPEEMRDELVSRMYFIADLDPQIRPFQITNDEYCRLFYAYKVISDDHPEILEYDSRAQKKKIEHSV